MATKNPFSGIDWSQLTINTISGFIVSTALLFLVDAFIPAHITETIFTEPQAGVLAVVGVVDIIGSAILGLMVDSIFHTLGRWFAVIFWQPLKHEFTYRENCMEDIGLTLRDFEWIYASNKDQISADVEKKYMRFTEVAGSSAYAMLLLLSPASFLFLKMEYNQPDWLSLGVAGVIAAAAVVLLLTSAESLSKYESKKTATALDDMRKLSSHFCASEKEKKDRKDKKDHWASPALAWLAVPVIVTGLLLLGLHVEADKLASAHRLVEEKHMTSMVLIGKLIDNKIPSIDFTVNKQMGTPGDQARSMVVILNDTVSEPIDIQLKNADLVQAANLPGLPKWKLSAALNNTSGVTNGDYIYINSLLSFDEPSSNQEPNPQPLERISVGEIQEGNWLFPIVVTDGKRDYLLAQVHVNITWASSGSAASPGSAQQAPPPAAATPP